jgi:tetratricopeptide (TPR) repeat protein
MNGRNTSIIRSIISLFLLLGIFVITAVLGQEQHQQQESESSFIQIGSSSIQYKLPFTTQYYPSIVVNVLQQYPLFDDNKKNLNDIVHNNYPNEDDDNEDEDEVNQVLLASWYVDLGIAHRTVMEEYYMEHLDPYSSDLVDDMGKYDDDKFIQNQKIYAITSIQEAIMIYDTLINKYQNLLMEETNHNDMDDNDRDDVNDSKDVATNVLIKMVIHEYTVTLSNAMFTLAETYTLLNDTTHAHPYYRNAYILYQQQLKEERTTDMVHDEQIEIHYAHCSVQLGLQIIHSLNMQNNIDYDDNNDGTTSILSEVIESSMLILDNTFWKSYMDALRQEDKVVDDASTTYSQESVHEYLMANLFDGDIILTEQYMIQYIRTEQAIMYFTNAVTIFRMYVLPDLVENDDNTNNLEHQQTLANVLQHLASCIYNHQIDYTKAIEYYEEAFEIYTGRIIPTLEHQTLDRMNYNMNTELIQVVLFTTDILFALTEMYFLRGQDEVSKERMRLCCTYSV